MVATTFSWLKVKKVIERTLEEFEDINVLKVLSDPPKTEPPDGVHVQAIGFHYSYPNYLEICAVGEDKFDLEEKLRDHNSFTEELLEIFDTFVDDVVGSLSEAGFMTNLGDDISNIDTHPTYYILIKG